MRAVESFPNDASCNNLVHCCCNSPKTKPIFVDCKHTRVTLLFFPCTLADFMCMHMMIEYPRTRKKSLCSTLLLMGAFFCSTPSVRPFVVYPTARYTHLDRQPGSRQEAYRVGEDFSFDAKPHFHRFPRHQIGYTGQVGSPPHPIGTGYSLWFRIYRCKLAIFHSTGGHFHVHQKTFERFLPAASRGQVRVL